jgi:hypothetical protein
MVMVTLPVDVYSVATVREIDRTAIEDEGIPGYALMKRAGAAAVSEARKRYPEARRWLLSSIRNLCKVMRRRHTKTSRLKVEWSGRGPDNLMRRQT